MKFIYRAVLVVSFLQLPYSLIQAQTKKGSESKPYSVITSGKRVTIKSNGPLKTVMLWSTNGHRVVELRDINFNSCSFIIPISEKIYFLMIQIEEKIYTDKIGIE
jgi:predicted kinase